jgi:hypothetical protein
MSRLEHAAVRLTPKVFSDGKDPQECVTEPALNENNLPAITDSFFPRANP